MTTQDGALRYAWLHAPSAMSEQHSRCAMALSSSPRRYGSGSRRWEPGPPTSCRAVRGKTAIVRASIRNSVTNCSTEKSSTRSRRQRSSSRTGDVTTTLCGHTHRWATSHQHPKQPSGLAKTVQRQHRRWPADPACTNIPNGSPHGARPSPLPGCDKNWRGCFL